MATTDNAERQELSKPSPNSLASSVAMFSVAMFSPNYMYIRVCNYINAYRKNHIMMPRLWGEKSGNRKGYSSSKGPKARSISHAHSTQIVKSKSRFLLLRNNQVRLFYTLSISENSLIKYFFGGIRLSPPFIKTGSRCDPPSILSMSLERDRIKALTWEEKIMKDREYLGDAVYVYFNGLSYEFQVNNHTSHTVITMENSVIDNLISFRERMRAQKKDN